MHKKDILLFVTGTSWSLLGFTRGLNSYDYNYTKCKSIHKEPYLYISKVQYGLLGIGIYLNPFLLPFNLYKEIYRLEVNTRGLEGEKNTDYYNNIF
jgi:hypothetical protein